MMTNTDKCSFAAEEGINNVIASSPQALLDNEKTKTALALVAIIIGITKHVHLYGRHHVHHRLRIEKLLSSIVVYRSTGGYVDSFTVESISPAKYLPFGKSTK